MKDHLAIGLCVLIGCGAPASTPVAEPKEQVCTLIACPDGLWIAIGEPDVGITVNEHTRVFGTSDGTAFECTPVPNDPDGSCGGHRGMHCTGADIQIDDVGDDSSGTCVRRLLNLGVVKMPKVVEATFETGQASIHRVFYPKYENTYLNGRDCGPSCTSAKERVF